MRAPEPQQTRLPAPVELRARLPLPPRAGEQVAAARNAIRDVLHGRDPRLLVLVGPCSIHDPLSALEYARALAKVARDSADSLVICMRAYFDKPRTTVGWKGLIRDPYLDGSGALEEGLALARRLLVTMAELGLPCAAELLDPLVVPYLHDTLAWGVIGARTSESQTHRELASGLDLPVGFKNGSEGSVRVARDAMVAARAPASYVGVLDDGRVGAVHTHGNPDLHLVLRGGCEPNYGPEHVQAALDLVADQGIARPLLVDCSHGNSKSDHTRQARAFGSVLAQIAAGETGICGLMLESHLKSGRQQLRPGRPLEYGVSITDACIDWPETERLLYEAAAVARAGEGRAAAGGAS